MARMTESIDRISWFWSPARGLVGAFDNLPSTSPDRVYQLWVIPPGAGAAPISGAQSNRLAGNGCRAALGLDEDGTSWLAPETACTGAIGFFEPTRTSHHSKWAASR